MLETRRSGSFCVVLMLTTAGEALEPALRRIHPDLPELLPITLILDLSQLQAGEGMRQRGLATYVPRPVRRARLAQALRQSMGLDAMEVWRKFVAHRGEPAPGGFRVGVSD